VGEVLVRVEVEVNPTEDSAKVKQAVENVFGSLMLEEKRQHGRILLTGQARGLNNLTHFGSLLRRERIRAAARTVLRQGRRGNMISFFLNKQVAHAGHVSFCEPLAESPLGPIKVEVETDNPLRLIDLLAPRTG
jgi:predicted RNA binding protein with dsRBD fold (UPF0201 family)